MVELNPSALSNCNLVDILTRLELKLIFDRVKLLPYLISGSQMEGVCRSRWGRRSLECHQGVFVLENIVTTYQSVGQTLIHSMRSLTGIIQFL